MTGFAALPLSGELPQAQRTRTLDAFRNGSVPVLVATDVAGRGIDVPDIAAVIHADLPKNPDDYTHRSGRTGRAGRKGRSIVLVPFHTRLRARRLLAAANVDASPEPVPTAETILKATRKQARRLVHERLAAGETPSEQELTYAASLLEGRDPAELVAVLLEMAGPAPCRAPAHLAEVRQPAEKASQRLSGSRKFARFFLNWGERRGATTQRVLAHVCRRGGIQGQQVGAIRVGPFSTTFEVDRQAAADFETRASRRDPREPKLRIARHRADVAAEQGRASA